MDCLFCKMVNGDIPTKKIYEDDKVIVILDLFPKSDAHSLIIPKKHYEDFIELDNDMLGHIVDVARKMTPTIMEKLNTTSLALAINYGDAQEIKHFHMHLLPNSSNKCKLSQDEAYELLKDTKF